MSCRQRPEYRRLTSSATHQVEEFEVATGGGSWVAAGARGRPRLLRLQQPCGPVPQPARHASYHMEFTSMRDGPPAVPMWRRINCRGIDPCRPEQLFMRMKRRQRPVRAPKRFISLVGL
jgi:hypothetical protein